MNLWKSGISLPPMVGWKIIQSKVTTELYYVEWPWQEKHHPQLIKQDFIKCFMEKTKSKSRGLRNEFVSPCLWWERGEFQLLTWASAGSAEVWTFSYCFTFTSWRWGTSCREEQEADVPPNLIWFSFLTRSTSPGYPLTLIAQSSLCVIHSARWWYPKSGYLGSCQYVHFPSSSNGEVLFLWCELDEDGCCSGQNRMMTRGRVTEAD